MIRTTDGGESWEDCSADLIRLADLPHLKSKIVSDTFAEGMATRVTFDLTFGILQKELNDMVVLSEDELAEGARGDSELPGYVLRAAAVDRGTDERLALSQRERGDGRKEFATMADQGYAEAN